MRTPYDTAAADVVFRGTGYPAAHLMFERTDPDAVAERYERASGAPLAPESLIDPAENPLARTGMDGVAPRPHPRLSMIYDPRHGARGSGSGVARALLA